MTIARLTNDQPTYLHPDLLDSPVAATDQQGNISWQEHYTPYGEKWGTTNAANDDQMGFTGHISDSATGLTYMQARYYDPVIGRFLSSDPVGFTGHMGGLQGTQGFNQYAYVNNNPFRYTDPTGMCSENSSIGVDNSCTDFTGIDGIDANATNVSSSQERLVDPKSGSITFNNDVQGGASTDLPVYSSLATALEDSVDKTGLSININSTTGGHSSGPHPQGRAADINIINGMRVDNPLNVDNVRAFQEALINHSNTNQVLGPVLNVNKWYNAPQPSPSLIRDHKNHIHVNVPR